MPDRNLLQEAFTRGTCLHQEDPKFRVGSPIPGDMYRIILAAVISLHENVRQIQAEISPILEFVRTLEYKPETPLGVSPGQTDKGGESPTATGPKLVDKPCDVCGEIMIQVHPSRKRHEKCKGAK